MYTPQDLPETERDALEFVRDIKGFYTHLAAYVICIAGMALANYIMTPNHIWFIWSALGWGLGVASHGLVVFEVISLFGPDWEKRQIEKRLQKNRN